MWSSHNHYFLEEITCWFQTGYNIEKEILWNSPSVDHIVNTVEGTDFSRNVPKKPENPI